jgi:hypothetical protein
VLPDSVARRPFAFGSFAAFNNCGSCAACFHSSSLDSPLLAFMCDSFHLPDSRP